MWSGVDGSSPGSPVANARVRVADNNCPDGGAQITRTLNTNSAGQLDDPGLPYSVYDVCADDGAKHVSAAAVSVEDLERRHPA